MILFSVQGCHELISGFRGFRVLQRTRIERRHPAKEFHREDLLLRLRQSVERFKEVAPFDHSCLKVSAYLAGTGSRSGSKTPPPKLIRSGGGPPFVTFTAQYLNSGIFPKGSSTGLVSMFAAAS
jgi:hypothetical protein